MFRNQEQAHGHSQAGVFLKMELRTRKKRNSVEQWLSAGRLVLTSLVFDSQLKPLTFDFPLLLSCCSRPLKCCQTERMNSKRLC